MKQDVLLFRSQRQVQHQRTEQASQRHQQGRVPGGARQPSERKWKEPRVSGASLVGIHVRAGTSGSHLLLCQTRGARGQSEHGSGGRVKKKKEKTMHAGRTVYRRSARQRVRTRYRRRISYKRRRARTFRLSARCYIRDEQHGSYFVAGAGEWTCFNSKFSFAEFPYQLRARWYGNFDQVKVLSVTYKIWIRDVSPDQ